MSGALHDALGDGENLRLHLEVAIVQLNKQYTEVGSAQVQRQEAATL